MPSALPPTLDLSLGVNGGDDLALVKRVMHAYRRAAALFVGSQGPWDTSLVALKRPVHDALIGDDVGRAAAVLRDPAASAFFWGFDATATGPAGEPEPHELVLRRLSRTDWRELYALWICDGLLSLSEAIGARRADYPEIKIDATLEARSRLFDVDAVIDEIERETGVVLNFPNPFPNELGLPSKRGIISFRAVQSVYQGWRVAQFARGNPDFAVLEIGAGLGRTTYFASLFGVKNYTIVDIPLTNAAQGYFLGRVMGDEHVALGDEANKRNLRIVPSADLENLDGTYNLIVNVDSLTEMPPDVAQRYWNFARKAGCTVLSINHEANSHTVRELYKYEIGARAFRYPYPMRRGYVEEIVSFAV